MLELDARAFYTATNAMQHMLTAIEGKKSHAPEPDGGVTITPISDPVFIGLLKHRLSVLQDALIILEAKLTAMEVARFQSDIEIGILTWEGISACGSAIRARLADELTLTKVFVLESEKQKYFEAPVALFGSEFQSKFATDGVFELDEAGKCLALGRPTACVFHLMRLMEIGVRATARCLGIPDPIKPGDRSWGAILETIWKGGIIKKWPTVSDRVHGEGALFEALHASLDAVKNPWRNSTMHVENKYTDDEAEHIFLAVKGFMKKLASRCDEKGLPLA